MVVGYEGNLPEVLKIEKRGDRCCSLSRGRGREEGEKKGGAGGREGFMGGEGQVIVATGKGQWEATVVLCLQCATRTTRRTISATGVPFWPLFPF